MNIVDEMPEEGQFVAVWEYNGEIWSDTFSIIDGELMKFSDDRDDFYRDSGVGYAIEDPEVKVKYIIK